jgi:hypothetical protein
VYGCLNDTKNYLKKNYFELKAFFLKMYLFSSLNKLSLPSKSFSKIKYYLITFSSSSTFTKAPFHAFVIAFLTFLLFLFDLFISTLIIRLNIAKLHHRGFLPPFSQHLTTAALFIENPLKMLWQRSLKLWNGNCLRDGWKSFDYPSNIADN